MPEFRFDMVTVTVPYLGGAPEEVDESVVVKVQEAIKNIQGIKEVRSTAADGYGQVRIELEEGFDLGELTDEVKLAVDGISTFPAETERPVIAKQIMRRGALNLQIHGSLNERAIRLYKGGAKRKSWHERQVEALAEHFGVSGEVPFRDLPEEFRSALFYGTGG